MCFALLLFVAAAAGGPAAPAAVDSSIFREKAAGERASFLVVLREQANLSGSRAIADRAERRRFVYESLRSVAEAAQRPLLERLSRLGIRHRSHYLVNMLEVEADEATARALAREPGVLAVEANRPAELSRVEPPELAPRREAAVSAIEPNLALIGAPAAWDRGFTGQGIVIGVADTGVQWNHPALIRQYRGWDGSAASHAYNWHDAVHDERVRQRLRLRLARALRRRGARHGGRGPRRGRRRRREPHRCRARRPLDRLPQHGHRRRNSGALRRMLRVFPRADRRERGEPAAGPRCRRRQQLVDLPGRGRLHGSGSPPRGGREPSRRGGGRRLRGRQYGPELRLAVGRAGDLRRRIHGGRDVPDGRDRQFQRARSGGRATGRSG